MNKILNVMRKTILCIFILIFTWIFILNIYKAITVQQFSILVFLLLFILFMFIVKKKVKLNIKIEIPIFVILFILLLIIGLNTKVKLTWDYGKLHLLAYNLCKGIPYDKAYLIRYQNNIPLFLIITVITKLSIILRPNITVYGIQTITTILNVLIIITTSIIIYYFTKKKFNSNQSFIILLFIVLFAPFYLYASIFYTDVISYLFMLIPLILYSCINKENTKRKNILWILCISIICSIGFKIKATNIFILIAIVIMLLFNKKIKNCICIVFSTLIIIFLINIFIGKIYYISDEENDKYKFPYTHWIMMTLNEDSIGGYVEDDVKFTRSFDTLSERKRATSEELKRRVNNYGTIKLLKKLFIDKAQGTWTTPDLRTSDYLVRQPLNRNIIQEVVTLHGKYYKIYSSILEGIYMFILFGVLLSGILNFKRNNIYVNLCQLCLLGIFIFLTIWESNARYLINFLPFILITSSWSYYELFSNIKKRKTT